MSSNLSGLTLETGQPESDVDTFVDPTATHDAHLKALNSLLLTLHRSSGTNSASKSIIGDKTKSLQEIISGPLGPHLTSSDVKTRERAALLVAELLTRLPELRIEAIQLEHLCAFLISRLEDSPSTEASLSSLKAIVTNERHAVSLSCTLVGDICRAILNSDTNIKCMPQLLRRTGLEIILAILKHPKLGGQELRRASFIKDYIKAVEGERDPRPLLVIFETLEFVQKTFDTKDIEACAQEIFTALSSYFPISLPQSSDPRGVTSEVLSDAMVRALCCSPSLCGTVFPFLLDKLASGVSRLSNIALGSIEHAIEAFGIEQCVSYFPEIARALWSEAMHRSGTDWNSNEANSGRNLNPDIVLNASANTSAVYALECLGRLSILVVHNDEVWSSVIIPLIDWALIELERNAGSMMARCGVNVLVVISKSTARGCRDVWSITGRCLLSSASALSGVEGQQQPEGGSITYSQQAALHVLVTLLESIYDKMDLSSLPLQPYISELVVCMTDAAQSMIVHVACIGISGLCAVITHTPSPILTSDGEVKDILHTLTALLNTTLQDVTVPDDRVQELMVDKPLLPVPSASLAALREIGIKKPRYAHQLLDVCVASLRLIMDNYTSLASKGVTVSRQGLARVFYSLRVLCEIPEVFEIVVPELLSWGIKMSSENNNCLENNADQVNERERINLNGFGAETAFSELAYALEYEGREAIGKQTFSHERLPLLITHVLDIKSDGRSEVFRSSVLRIVSCCIRRADAEAQDALLNNLLRLLRERGAGRNYSMLAAALGVIRNESPLLSAIANEPEPLNSIVRIGAGTITTTADMSSGTTKPDNEQEECCKCLASLLNKLPPGHSLERIMNMVKMALHSSPFEIQEDVEGGIIGSSSLCLRMWTCKGLIMRDSGENSLCKDLMDELWGSVVENNMESASAFQTLIAEEGDENSVTSVPVFYRGRRSPIWKQKLLFTFLPEINAKLQLSSGCQLALSYTSEDVSGSPNLALLLAALHIFSAVPLKVLDTVAEAATEAATRGLVSMVPAMFQPSFHLLSILCCSAPTHVAGRLPHLVPALLGLACSSQSTGSGLSSNMPRSSRGRSAPARAPARRAPVRKPAPAKTAAPPAPRPAAAPPAHPAQQSGGGGMMSGLAGTVVQGFGFGVGSSIAHRAVGTVANSFSGGSSEEAPLPPEQGAYETNQFQQQQMPPQQNPINNGPCGTDQVAWTNCLQSNNGDLEACTQLYDALQACQINAKQTQFM